MQEHRRTISFGGREGFRPTPDSPWVPFSALAAQAATASKDIYEPSFELSVPWRLVASAIKDQVETDIPCDLWVVDDEALGGFVEILNSETDLRKNGGRK